VTTSFFALRAVGFAFGAAALLLSAGCADNNKSVVSGTVLVDGQPLANGTIQFFPSDGNGQTGAAGVTDGKYTANAGVGDMKVIITGIKVVGKIKQYDTPDSPTVDDVRELLPDKYNKNTELTATLKPGPNAGVDFDLKSK